MVLSVNIVGLRRAGIAEPVRNEIKKSYRYLYRAGLKVSHALEKIKAEFHSPEVQHLVRFIESSERGILAGGGAVVADGGGESEESLLPRKRPSPRD